MIERTNITWDLAPLGALNVYWSEPHPFESRWTRHWLTIYADAPWEPWQIAGVVEALRSGRVIGDGPGYGLVPGAEPELPRWRRVAANVEGAALGVLEWVTRGHSMAGAR